MDLLSLVLTLRPIRSSGEGTVLPLWWGRAAHALLLNVVRQYDLPLAARLHEAQETRPFTVSTLLGRFPQGQLDRQQPYALRLTALQPDLAAILWSACQAGGPLSASSTLELDYHPFAVLSLSPSPPSDLANSPSEIPNPPSAIPPSPWCGAATYADLAAAWLVSAEPAPRRLELHFTSPTTFKSGGRHVPLPLPELVFGSLLERWNAFAPIAFPPEARRYAAECLAVARYRLSSRSVPLKSGGLRVGGVGQIAYISTSYDRYWMSVMAALAAFALYAGVGASTTMGLGQCRMLDVGRRISD